MSQNNIIELNGKRYDALTGRLLGDSTATVLQPLPAARAPKRSVDGMMSKTMAKKGEPKRSPAKPVLHPLPKTSPKRAAIVKAHQPEKAKTLMRRAVHKPKTTPKLAIKPQTASELMAAPIKAVTAKRSVRQIDPQRMHRAKQTPKHEHVRRFSPSALRAHSSSPSLAVRPQPKLAAQVVAPMPHQTSDIQPAKKQPKNIFEDAMARATSHEQPAHKAPKHHKKHSRLVNTLAGVAAFLVLGGFLAYLNMPQIELRVASFQAGFSAQLPDYSPTGYQLTNIEHRHGVINLSFRSGESDYKISQQPSNWNSQTLKDDLIATADHQTVESKGRIIYVHENTASWVNGGVRYDITGNAHLSKDDIVDIATSM